MDKSAFKVVINGQDKTALFADRLESITVVDNAGLDSDTAEIVLDDRDQIIALPAINAEMELWLGTMQHQQPQLTWAGLYTIDEIETDDYEGTLSLHGKAADMLGSLKAPHNASYDDITLETLLTTIAQRHGYQPIIAPALAKKHYAHIDQRSQSDIDLLTAKASELSAVCKPTGKRLCLLLEDANQTASGKSLTRLPLDAKVEGTYINARIAGRNEYGAVKAYWQGADDSQKHSVSVGGGETVYTMRSILTSHQHAVDTVKAKWSQLKRGGVELTCERPLSVTYAAERHIDLVNHRHAGEYVIKTATHTLGQQVSTTTLLLRLPSARH